MDLEPDNQNGKKTQEHYIGVGIALGAGIGAALGAGLGIALDMFPMLIGVGTGAGAGVGVALGAVFRQANQEKE